MPDDVSYPPCGFDRADGLDGNPGTATPSDALQIRTALGLPAGAFLEEDANSPEIELGEHATFVHTFKCDPVTGQEILYGNPRGTPLVDSQGYQYKVLTTSSQYQKGHYCIVRITAEWVDVPPEDEFHVETVEFNPSIFLHPRYASVVNYSAENAGSTDLITGPFLMGLITNAANMSTPQSQTGFYNLLNNYNVTDPAVLELCLELITKLQRGEDTFYLSGWRVFWSQYNTYPGSPAGSSGDATGLNPGGYTEDPVTEGGLPSYFWSLDGTPTGDNTFTVTSETVNPQYYENGISWLRQADTVEYSRVWFKVIHSWIGGPLGTWDVDIYSDGTDGGD
jgi:hypothetical protein